MFEKTDRKRALPVFSKYCRDTHLSVGPWPPGGLAKCRFRAEGVRLATPTGSLFDQAALRQFLEADASTLHSLSPVERRTRANEVARLTWGLATLLCLPGREGSLANHYGIPGPAWRVQDVVQQGLRLMTLEAGDLIDRFKDSTTKLVQLSVGDLSPAAVSNMAVRRGLTKGLFFPPHIASRMCRRAMFEPEWAVGVQQTKRVSAPMREEKKESSLHKHLALISQEQDLDHTLVEVEVRRTVREILEGRKSWRLRRSPLPVFPSTSASYESTRKDGGALGYFARLYGTGKMPGDIPDDNTKVLCRRVGIVEPMKLRVISAGTAEHYNRVSGYQHALWGLLRDHPTFQLIHRPLVAGDVKRFWKAGRRLFGTKLKALSGDYSAATDNLHPRLSEAVLDELLRRTTEEFETTDADLLKACLTGHLIRDPPKKVRGAVGKGANPPGEGVVTPQRWGQLMGSPISFPILCIINAAVCRAAVEAQLGGRKLSLRRTGILINGDDCLVPCGSTEGFKTWEALARKAGLNPSPGKCFLSEKFAQLNSQLYEGDQAVSRTFFRLNLLWGLVSKGMEAGLSPMSGREGKFLSLGDRMRALLRDVPCGQKLALRALIRRVNLGDILASRPIPLHLHTDFGGLCVPYLQRQKGRSFRIGPNQRRLVALVSRSPEASQILKDRLAALRAKVSGNPALVALETADQRWYGTSSTQFCVWRPKTEKARSATPSMSLRLETVRKALDDESTKPEPCYNLDGALTMLRRFWEKVYRWVKSQSVSGWREPGVLAMARDGLEVEPLRVCSTEFPDYLGRGGADTIGWCRTLPEYRQALLA